MKPDNILYLAYYFPPMGMAGVMRTVKFIKYLPKFGYEPAVITVKPLSYHAYDHTLLDEIPDDVGIIRTESLEPLRIMRLMGELTAKLRGSEYETSPVISTRSRWGGYLVRALLPPDEKILWHPFLIPGAVRELRDGDYKAIVTTSPPESIHLAGLVIHRMTGIPWIADFRDAWTTNLLRKNQPFISRWLDRYFEGMVVRNCTRMITVTEELKDEFITRYPEVSEDKFITITNGFDHKELTWHKPEKDTDKLVITHCGNFSSFQSASYFLRAVSELIDERPHLKDEIQVSFVGVMREDEVEMIERSDLSEVVELKGYLPHKQALEEQLNSDILLLIAHPEIEKTRILGKTFEYLWARRPIFAVAPEGATVNLIRRENAGFSVHPGDVEGIKEKLLDVIEKYKSDGLAPLKDEGLLRYTRENLTGDLVDVLDDIIR